MIFPGGSISTKMFVGCPKVHEARIFQSTFLPTLMFYHSQILSYHRGGGGREVVFFPPSSIYKDIVYYDTQTLMVRMPSPRKDPPLSLKEIVLITYPQRVVERL